MASQQPIYGNFQRYYHIRNPTGSSEADSGYPALRLDSRLEPILAYLEESAHSVRDVLDIGCNAGRVTIQLAQMLELSVSITGVDIDATLVKQAKDAAATARSLCRPLSSEGTTTSSSARQLPSDSVYFPSIFPSLFGPRPEEDGRPTKRAKTSESTPVAARFAVALQPPRLNFVAAEWATYGSPINGAARDAGAMARLREKDAQGYDLVLALSLTKWVHIHSGDAGLARFFARISRCLRTDGLLILEPQDWRSYDAPKRMSKAMRDQVTALKMRPQGDFHWLLESVGLVFVQTIGVGVGTGFTRPLQVFRKPPHTTADVLVDTLLGTEPVQFPWVTRAHKPSSDDA